MNQWYMTMNKILKLGKSLQWEVYLPYLPYLTLSSEAILCIFSYILSWRFSLHLGIHVYFLHTNDVILSTVCWALLFLILYNLKGHSTLHIELLHSLFQLASFPLSICVITHNCLWMAFRLSLSFAHKIMVKMNYLVHLLQKW